MNNKRFIAALAAVGFAVAMDANAAVINFQENDSPANTSTLLGTTATFTDGGASLMAAGFGPGVLNSVPLFAKFTTGDPTETGLGLLNDPSGEHEITVGSFIQLTVPPSPPGSVLNLIIAGSVQSGESAVVSFNLAPGTLGGGVPITGTAGPGPDQTMFTISSGAGFIDITAGSGNVLLDSATVTVPQIPDGGMTVAMLGGALTLLGFARRKLVA